MKKILLDGKMVESLVPESLPMLIHGKEGSGASLYTICVAAQWFSQGYKVLILCGYPMAEQEFANQLESDYSEARFYTKEKVEEFLHTLKQDLQENTVVIVKNIELFESNVFDAISEVNNLIISGNIGESVLKNKLLNKKFTTQIFFSAIEGIDLPELEKYHGFVMSVDYNGVTQLQ